MDEFPGRALDCELAAQVGDVGLDDGDFAVPVVFPHVVEYLHLGDHAPGVDDEVAQELELGGGQVDGDAGACDFVRVFVDDQVSDA